MTDYSNQPADVLHRIHAAIRQLQDALSEFEPLAQQLAQHASREEYLSIKDLVERIPYEEQTVRNLMSQGELREGDHYLQRVKHGRVVFVWSRMQEWMRDRPSSSGPLNAGSATNEVEPFYRGSHARTRKER